MSQDSDSEFHSQETGRFYIKDGATMMTRKKGEDIKFGDFTLRLLGELSPLKGSAVGEEGFWIAACGVLSGQLISQRSRIIVIPASTFNSRIKFQETLCKKLGGGVVSLGGGVTGGHVSEYYFSLKSEYAKEDAPRRGFKTNHLGHQLENYWCLSQQQHIMKNKIVPMDRQQVFVIDDSILQQYSAYLNPALLSTNYLQNACKRYIELAENFKANAVPFLLSTAFVLVRNIVTTMEGSIGESNIGIIYSNHKNVGKSLTQSLLALGQGIESKSHPLLCGGGDQNVSGISVKMLMQILQKTTLTCFLDDPQLTVQLCEFLLQINNGLTQGSTQTGLSIPKGSILLSTNSKECDRIRGRVLRIDYVKDDTFNRGNEENLYLLQEHLEENLGLLIAWVMRFLELWAAPGSGDILCLLRNMIEKHAPGQQARWYKGAMFLLYTYAMFHTTAGVECDLGDPLSKLVASVAMPPKEQPFWERMNMAIHSKLEQAEESPLVWLNPNVQLRVGGNLKAGVAILNAAINNFSNVSGQEVKEELEQVSDMGKKTISLPFASSNDSDCSLEDLKKKTPGKVRYAKAYRIPRTKINVDIQKIIDYKCGLSSKPEDLHTQDESEVEHQSEQPSIEDEREHFMEITRLLQKMGEQFNQDESDGPAQPDLENNVKIAEELTPKSKEKYLDYTPRRRAAFQEGFLSAQRKEDNLNEPPDYIHDNQAESIEPAKKRRRLEFAEGTIGVLPVQETSNCHECGKSSPKQKKNQKKKVVDWVLCDKCSKWYHLQCANLTTTPEKDEEWECKDCKTDPQTIRIKEQK